MNETDDKRQRIRDKVAASQERLQRDSAELPAIPSPTRFPDAYPPENYRSLAGEYPWLAMAAGLGAGLLFGALLPKGTGGKLGKRALAAATIAGEVGLALSKQARDKAADASREGLARTGESAAQLRGRVNRAVDPARQRARSTGLVIAREAIKLAARVRK